MDQSTEIVPERIDELLSTYRALQAQFERVRDRLRRAEESKHTVQRRIYDRVRSDYDRELDSIRARMSPIRDEIDQLHATLEARWQDVKSAVQTVEEELAEAEFRHRIGEYEDDRFADLQSSLDVRARNAREAQDTLQASLSAIAALRNPGAVPDAPVAAEAVEERPAPADMSTGSEIAELDLSDDMTPAEPAEAVAPESPQAAAEAAEAAEPEPLQAAPRPVLKASGLGPSSHAQSFEDPHSWVADMGGDSPSTERTGRPASPAPAAAAVATMETTTDEATSAPAPTPAESPNLPSLVFVSGPHAGEAIPLLPTSLTLGREHDNNVEIKDADVARYHARIQRHQDSYVVEDLNSSTGTWVNGERTQRAVLTHGDVIRLGQTELAIDFEWTTDSR